MEGLVGAAALSVLAYGNYLMFNTHWQSLFWALCCNSIRRKYGIAGNVFYALIVSVIPLVIALCLEEIIEGTSKVLKIEGINSIVDPLLKWSITMAKEKRCRDHVDLLIRIEDYVKEWAIKNLSNIVVFLGASTCFSLAEGAPIFFLTKGLGPGVEIARLFDDLVRTLVIGGFRHFVLSVTIGVVFGSSFSLCGGVCAAFLSAFPLVPIFFYSLPAILLFCLEKKYLIGTAMFLCAILQEIIVGKGCGVRGMSAKLRVLGIGVGMKVFGLAGAIAGPFLLGSLMMVIKDQRRVVKDLKSTKEKEIRDVKDILRKRK